MPDPFSVAVTLDLCSLSLSLSPRVALRRRAAHVPRSNSRGGRRYVNQKIEKREYRPRFYPHWRWCSYVLQSSQETRQLKMLSPKLSLGSKLKRTVLRICEQPNKGHYNPGQEKDHFMRPFYMLIFWHKCRTDGRVKRCG